MNRIISTPKESFLLSASVWKLNQGRIQEFWGKILYNKLTCYITIIYGDFTNISDTHTLKS